MNRFLCLWSALFCIVFYSNSYAQNNAGRYLYIVDKETGSPVHDAVCNSYDENNKLVAYDFSDANGMVKLKNIKIKYLVISNMGYDKRNIDISSVKENYKNIIQLTPKTTKLKEIVVKTAPIVKQNDTIVYNVASFASKEDRYIGDVLKKLPGVSVSDNGGISYQGKAISKLYIEGQDLMDTRYGQMTNNFPVEAVSQVHLMENHQNIKVLKDKVFEERAALNIKLKKDYKSKIFGYVDAGVGAKPILWDTKAFATVVSRKVQNLLTVKSNNTGADLASEIGEHISISSADVYMFEPFPFLDFNSVSRPPFDKKRYLQNKAISFGVNNLFATTENSNLKLNLNGYIDKINARCDKFSLYGGNTPISLSQTNISENKPQSYSAKMSYELNNTSVYLKDELAFKLSYNKQLSNIKDNNILNMQEMILKPRFVQNTLNATFGFGKRFVTFNSAIRFYDRKEILNNTSSLSSSVLSALYQNNEIGTRNFVSTSLFDYGKMSSKISLSADFYQNRYRDLQNNVQADTKDLNLSLSPSFNMKGDNWGRLNVSLPIALNSQSLHLDKNISDTYLTLNPMCSYTVDFLQNWRFNIGYHYKKGNDWAAKFYSPNSLMLSHRLKLNTLSELFRKEMHSFNSSIFYQNPLSMVFASLECFYSLGKSGYYRSYDYKENKTEINIKNGRNDIQSLFVLSSIDKTFADHRLSVKLGLDYNLNRFQLSQNGKTFINNSNLISAKAFFDFKKWNIVKVFYSSVANFSYNRNEVNSGDVYKKFDNQVELFVYPTKNILANISYQNITNQISANNYKSSNFLDFKISYIINKRFEIKGEVNNILNNNRYFVSSYDGINFHSSEMPLRQREFLVSCKWNF